MSPVAADTRVNVRRDSDTVDCDGAVANLASAPNDALAHGTRHFSVCYRPRFCELAPFVEA
jgi:hypothetical protein